MNLWGVRRPLLEVNGLQMAGGDGIERSREHGLFGYRTIWPGNYGERKKCQKKLISAAGCHTFTVRSSRSVRLAFFCPQRAKYLFYNRRI